MKSRDDNPGPDQPDDDDEPREYSSPACYMHEFDWQGSAETGSTTMGGITAGVRIALESPNQPGILALIEELDAYQKPLYPAESHHGIDIAALCRPNVLFAVARSAQGEAVACGAVVLEHEYGEIKRMYTKPSHRGRGIARQLLVLLESEAMARGCREFILETGYLQAEAIAMYERCGYQRRGPFGEYREDPNSIFMSKKAPSP